MFMHVAASDTVTVFASLALSTNRSALRLQGIRSILLCGENPGQSPTPIRINQCSSGMNTTLTHPSLGCSWCLTFRTLSARCLLSPFRVESRIPAFAMQHSPFRHPGRLISCNMPMDIHVQHCADSHTDAGPDLPCVQRLRLSASPVR
jgi:hypothetical protein